MLTIHQVELRIPIFGISENMPEDVYAMNTTTSSNSREGKDGIE